MTTESTPADAVREAPTELERIIAEMREPENSGQFGPWQFTADNIKDWADRLAALAGAAPVGEVQRASPEVMIGALDQSKVKPGDKLFTHAPAKAREDGLAVALRHVVKVLGPQVPSSVTDQGARYEWDEALRVAEAALATFAEGGGP